MTSDHATLHWRDYGRGHEGSVARHLLNWDTGRHDHDFMEMAVIVGGVARHITGAGEAQIGRRFAVLLRPGSWHAYKDCQNLEVINLLFPVAMARSEWRGLLGERVRAVLRSGERMQTATLSEESIDALERLERIDRSSTGTLGLILWTLDRFASQLPPRDELHSAVEDAVCALEDHPGEAWTTVRLAKTVGLDRAYLSRLFKAQVGSAPMTYLAILRAERAASLLRSSELSCAEVGLAVGYPDANLFSRRFRARYGMSPTAYRRQHFRGI